ncbi:PEP-utilizing enzyme [Thermosulfuriphilus sp.]
MNLFQKLRALFQSETEIDLSPQELYRTRIHDLESSLEEALNRLKTLEDLLHWPHYFDLQTVQRHYRDFRRSLLRSLNDFFFLTGKDYLILAERFEELDLRIKNLLNGEIPPKKQLILPLESLDMEDIGLTGPGIAFLAEAKNYLQVPIPDGLVIGDWVFELFVRENGLEGEIKKGPSEEVIEQILKGSFSRRIEEELEEVLMSCQEEDKKAPFVLELEGGIALKSPPQKEAFLEACKGLFALFLKNSSRERPLILAFREARSSESLRGRFLTFFREEKALFLLEAATGTLTVPVLRKPPFFSTPPEGLDPLLLSELILMGLELEKYFGEALEIRWMLDDQGFQILRIMPLGDTPPATEDGALVRGIPACPGIVSGYPVIVSEGDLQDIPPEAILLVQEDLNLYVSRASRTKALLARKGNPASHMAKACRRLKVPCLVALKGGFDRLRPNEPITVDANQGWIYKGGNLKEARAPLGFKAKGNRPRRILRRAMEFIRPDIKGNLPLDPRACHRLGDMLFFIKENLRRRNNGIVLS